jgi:hypothetical protein
MSGHGILRVGDISVRLTDGIGTELLAVFRDDMMRLRSLSEIDYDLCDSDSEDLVEILEYRSPGKNIADRLDALSVTARSAMEILEESLNQSREFLEQWSKDGNDVDDSELALLSSITSQGWVDNLRESLPHKRSPLTPGTRPWLLHFLDYWDPRYALRACLLAFPDSEVVLDITDLDDQESLASDSLRTLQSFAEARAPIVVLTEGRTDAEFLSAALKIIYPHLDDLIRFLDFNESKNEGGTGALVKTVKAFSAAGIANRVVAIFDNDAAASAALRSLDQGSLSDNIKVLQYPTIELAREYPTLGPPTIESPAGTITLADINGLAGSIEVYLGSDVLTHHSGHYYPVQWRSYVTGPNVYQGEVQNKAEVHEAFRRKIKAALHRPTGIVSGDWKDLRRIIDTILTAFDE